MRDAGRSVKRFHWGQCAAIVRLVFDISSEMGGVWMFDDFTFEYSFRLHMFLLMGTPVLVL